MRVRGGAGGARIIDEPITPRSEAERFFLDIQHNLIDFAFCIPIGSQGWESKMPGRLDFVAVTTKSHWLGIFGFSGTAGLRIQNARSI